MRYLVVKQSYEGQGEDRRFAMPNKLARFAFACDATKFAKGLAKEQDCVYTQVLDTHLKKTYFDSREGVL